MKVMFSQVSVCPQEMCIPACNGADTPWAGTLPGRYTPWSDTPRQVQPPGRYTPWQVHPQQIHPPAQCMLGYGTQAGSMHPTGMHSCFMYHISTTLFPNYEYRAKTGNNVSEFMHSNWMIKSYYSSLKYKSLLQ